MGTSIPSRRHNVFDAWNIACMPGHYDYISVSSFYIQYTHVLKYEVYLQRVLSPKFLHFPRVFLHSSLLTLISACLRVPFHPGINIEVSMHIIRDCGVCGDWMRLIIIFRGKINEQTCLAAKGTLACETFHSSGYLAA